MTRDGAWPRQSADGKRHWVLEEEPPRPGTGGCNHERKAALEAAPQLIKNVPGPDFPGAAG
jgi:hypothetical protein